MSALVEELKTALREMLPEIVSALREELLAAPREDGDRLVNVDEAARRLGLGTSTVYKRSEKGDLPSVKDGSRLLFRIADLVAYAEARRRSPERVKELARSTTTAGTTHKGAKNP